MHSARFYQPSQIKFQLLFPRLSYGFRVGEQLAGWKWNRSHLYKMKTVVIVLFFLKFLKCYCFYLFSISGLHGKMQITKSAIPPHNTPSIINSTYSNFIFIMCFCTSTTLTITSNTNDFVFRFCKEYDVFKMNSLSITLKV